MIFFYLLSVFLILLLNAKYFEIKNNQFIYIALSLFSPVFFFVKIKLNADIFNSMIIDKIFIIGFLVLTSLYYLFVLINKKDEAISINKYVFPCFALLALNGIWIKSVLLIITIVYFSIKRLNTKTVVPIRAIFILLGLVFINMQGVAIPSFSMAILVTLIGAYYLIEKVAVSDLYALLLFISISSIRYDLRWIYFSIGMLIVIKILDFILISTHKLNLKSILTKNSFIEKISLNIDTKFKKNIVLIDESDLKVIPMKKLQPEILDYNFSDINITYITVSLLLLLAVGIGVL